MPGSKVLKPAQDVFEEPYDLQELSGPRVHGWLLRLFVWILESALGQMVMPRLLRDSGFPQVLAELEIPDPPTFQPLWPASGKAIGNNEISVASVSARERVNAAATTLSRTKLSERQGAPRSSTWTIADFQEAYSNGTTTPSQVAEHVLAAIAASEALNPPMRLFAAQDPSDLKRQAAESTRRYKEGSPRSILEGVPFAAKDSEDALPYPTNDGTVYVAELRKATADSPMVANLRECGAMLVGKSAMVELGTSAGGYNIIQGTPRNPHDPTRLTGGSSSGNGGIIASGICALAIGKDGGGSIRIPSSFCGIVGLLPTYIRGCEKGTSDTGFTVSSAGPMAGCVADAALMYAVTANTGDEDKLVQPMPPTLPKRLSPPISSRPLEGVRIGIYRPWFDHADAEVVAACHAAVGHLSNYGAQVVDITIPELQVARIAHHTTICSEFAQSHKANLRVPGLRSRCGPLGTLATTLA